MIKVIVWIFSPCYSNIVALYAMHKLHGRTRILRTNRYREWIAKRDEV